jgi:ubiquinone/menaquinone biosynthesis C-methylase UbiE
VRRLYAGPAGGVLRTLSYLSMHVPLSESWLRDRVFDLHGAKRILDAGCGAGQLTGHLAKYADSDASITACDLSVEMLLRARQRLANPAIQFVLGDITQLPFADASFDCVTCGYALEHLPDPRSGLAELARVLRVGGRLLLLTTEDRWTGVLTSRVWNCHTYDRQELRRLCREQGLVWKQELSFSKFHQRLGMGGICVEIERQEIG